MLATQYAEWYNITPQAEGESDENFKHRVAGALRDAGQIIEAHEVQADARWDGEGSTAITGIAGAMAMALQGIDYGRTGSTRVGDEMAAGVIATSRASKPSADELLLTIMMRGLLK